jgi:hypothetical protein
MDWSYLAGFFDGEGNLHVIKVKKWYFFQIRMYSTDLFILEEIKEFLGYGRIYSRKRVKNHNIMHELYITKKELIMKFLENILPFLKIKKKQAEFMFIHLKETSLSDDNFSKEKFQSFITRIKSNSS